MASLPLERDLAQPPHVAVARILADRFRAGMPVDRLLLRHLCGRETGASDSTGAWSMRQAYDALELA